MWFWALSMPSIALHSDHLFGPEQSYITMWTSAIGLLTSLTCLIRAEMSLIDTELRLADQIVMSAQGHISSGNCPLQWPVASGQRLVVGKWKENLIFRWAQMYKVCSIPIISCRIHGVNGRRDTTTPARHIAAHRVMTQVMDHKERPRGGYKWGDVKG